MSERDIPAFYIIQNEPNPSRGYRITGWKAIVDGVQFGTAWYGADAINTSNMAMILRDAAWKLTLHVCRMKLRRLLRL